MFTSSHRHPDPPRPDLAPRPRGASPRPSAGCVAPHGRRTPTAALAAVLVGLVGLLTHPALARADEPAFTIGSQPAWFLLGGLTTGGVPYADRGGAFVGGEISVVRLDDGMFSGFFADAFYDFGIGGAVLGLGPEIGWHLGAASPAWMSQPLSLGFDVGGALRFVGETQLGATARVHLTAFGVLSVYARYAWFSAPTDTHSVLVGVTLKFVLAPPF